MLYCFYQLLFPVESQLMLRVLHVEAVSVVETRDCFLKDPTLPFCLVSDEIFSLTNEAKRDL